MPKDQTTHTCCKDENCSTCKGCGFYTTYASI